MLVLFAAMVIYAFLLLGAMVFVASIAIPTCRMYSLSTALWFAACGPFLTGVAILAGLAIVANSAVMNGDHFSVAVSGLQKILWRGSAVAGLIGVAIAATAIAWVHQFVIHRMTFALFRVYVTAVCTGIGSVLGLFLFLLLNYFHNVYAFLSVLIGSLSLCIVFGNAGYRYASALRGDYPEKYAWITEDEFKEKPRLLRN